jgi:hypothetical protein
MHRRTDRTKLTVTFRNFVNAPKNRQFPYISKMLVEEGTSGRFSYLFKNRQREIIRQLVYNEL